MDRWMDGSMDGWIDGSMDEKEGFRGATTNGFLYILWIHRSIHRSIHPSIHRSIHPSSHRSIDPSDGSGIVPFDESMRRQTRPIGELGGNIGAGFWSVFIPFCIWYFYGCAILDQGSLHMPPWDFAWWQKLYSQLPDGIAIRP